MVWLTEPSVPVTNTSMLLEHKQTGECSGKQPAGTREVVLLLQKAEEVPAVPAGGYFTQPAEVIDCIPLKFVTPSTEAKARPHR
jgi:hypothetical protein